MEIKEESFTTWAEVKKVLDSKAKEKELGYEQKNALEFLKKFCKLGEKDAKELVGALKEIDKLKEKHMIMIADAMPQDADELKTLFSNESVSLSDDDKKAILSAVKKAL